MKIQDIDATILDGSVKGIPGDVQPFPLGQIDAKGWNVLRGDLPLPLAVLRQSALRHNGHWMREIPGIVGRRDRATRQNHHEPTTVCRTAFGWSLGDDDRNSAAVTHLP